ncbi:hypothetical protein [Streptomyces sp. NPDC101776]|uniref:hypothetical protein n=1 Tax=Streptomyces sp. NPDC101776 TaxID=3366146 RepID=UPI0037FEEB4A
MRSQRARTPGTNARYLMPRADHDFWHPGNNHRPRTAAANANVFDDSVAPVVDAGQAVLWEDVHDIDAVRFAAPAPAPRWDGIRDATAPGGTAPARTRSGFGGLDLSPVLGPGWAPATSP